MSQLGNVLAAAPVAALQLRLKNTADDEIVKMAETILPICHANNCLLIINDYPEIALEVEADGVHLGQDDLAAIGNIKKAREMLGNNAIIGITCHNSKDLAFKAGSDGADYIAFGSMFSSPTKPDAVRADMELIKWWYEAMTIPAVAIGGITPLNAKQVIAAGADFICVSSGVWDWPDGPELAVQLLSDLCVRHSPS